MQHEKNIAIQALKIPGYISLKIETEETITSTTHTLITKFYKNQNKTPSKELKEIITNEDSKPLCQQSLQIAVGYFKTDKELKGIVQKYNLKISNPTTPKGTGGIYKSSFTISRA